MSDTCKVLNIDLNAFKDTVLDYLDLNISLFKINLRYGFSTTAGKETITPIPDPDVKLGGGIMTETDILKINRLYECEGE